MRHRHQGRKLGRTGTHRRAMLRNMAASLFGKGRLVTTLPKAKDLRRFAEPLITLASVDSVATRRLAFARLRNRSAIERLFRELGPRYRERKGGYLRVLRYGFRPGDRAPRALVELVSKSATAGVAPSTDAAPSPLAAEPSADT